MKTILILCFATIICTHSAIGCRCDDPGSVQEAFEYTPVILRGKVLSKTFVSMESVLAPEKVREIKESYKGDLHKMNLLTMPLIEIQLKIVRTFKGAISAAETFTLYTPRSGATCGFVRFQIGEEYLIYASTENFVLSMFLNDPYSTKNSSGASTYWTHQCTRTTEYNEEEERELIKLAGG